MDNYIERKRIDAFDVCKGACMLMVILGHQFEKYALIHPLQIIQTFHMPLFFMISGFFISEADSIPNYAQKRAKRLLVPYVLGCIVMIVLCSIKQWIDTHSAHAVFLEIWKRLWISFYGSGSGHGSFLGSYGYIEEIGMFWYLIALFWASVVVRIIIAKDYKWAGALLVSAIGIGTSIVFGWIPFSIQSGLGAVFWVYLGYFIKSNNLLAKILVLFKTRIWLLVIPAWLLSALFGCIHLYENQYRLGIVDILGAACGAWLVFILCSWIATKNTAIKKTLIFVGQNTVLIYSLHFLENSVYPISDCLMRFQVFDTVVLCLVSWIAISIVTILLTLLLTKFSAVKKLYS